MPAAEGNRAVTSHHDDIRRLREALLQAPPGENDSTTAEGPQTEVDPDRIWAAVHEQLDEGELARLVEQVLTSPSAMEQWRMALEMKRLSEETESPAMATIHQMPERPDQGASNGAGEGASEGPGPSRRRGVGRAASWLAAVAASGLLLSVLAWQWRTPEVPFETRGIDPTRIEQTVERAPRDAFELEWDGPTVEGVESYEVVLTHGVETLYRATDLQQPRVRIPVEAFDALEPGSTLLWSVEATLADGSTIRSGPFKTVLQ